LMKKPASLCWRAVRPLSGAPLVGINPTRQGAELAGDIAHADIQLVVTDEAGAQTLRELGGLADERRILVVRSSAYNGLLEQHDSATPSHPPDPATLLML